MPKKYDRIEKESSIEYRRMIESHWRTHFFNLFMTSYQWEDLTREEREFIMRQLWRRGTICAFRINDDVLGFAPFAEQNWNMYGSPTEVNLINIRGVRYIPSYPLKTGTMRNNVARALDEPEVVIGWAQHSKTSVRDLIDPIVQKIVDLEMAARTNRFAMKLPILYGVTPENKNKMEELLNKIFNDEISAAVEMDEVDAIKTLSQNPPFILDKIRNEIASLENQALTLLGIDNKGNSKAEREGVDEVNANNEVINDNQLSVLENLQEWCELVNEGFGRNLSVSPKFASVDSFHDDVDGKETNEDDDQE